MPRHPANHVPTDLGSFNLDHSIPIVPQLYNLVRARILKLQLKPGELVSEAELAAASGVSRTPARQAIKQLVSENLLVILAGRGTYVSKIDTGRLKDALIIRRQLEPFLAKECALDSDRSTLVAKLRDILAKHEAALQERTIDRAYSVDAAFHKAICTRDNNGLIWQTVRQARTEADRLHTLSRDRANSLQNALLHHREIVDAIEAGDADRAYSAMESHMQVNEEAFNQILVENPELFSNGD